MSDEHVQGAEGIDGATGIVSVIVSDPNPRRRRETRSLIEESDSLVVVAETATAPSTLEALARHGAEVVVVDVAASAGEGGDDGDRVLQALRESDVATVVLGDSSDPRTVDKIASTGVNGYLLRGRYSTGDLVEAVLGAPHGECTVSPPVAAVLLSSHAERPRRSDDEKAAAGLTGREHELMGHLVKGRSNAEIAAAMVISVQSVKNKVSSVLAKLGCANRAEAIAWWTGHCPELPSRAQAPRDR